MRRPTPPRGLRQMSSPLTSVLVLVVAVVVPVAVVALVVAGSRVASAHEGAHAGSGGASVAFPVVLWVPVFAGLLGGLVAVSARRRGVSTGHGAIATVVFGALVLALGGAFAVTALADRSAVAVAGVCAGAVATYGYSTRVRGRRRADTGFRDDEHTGHRGGLDGRQHGHVTLWGLCGHRLLEGVAVGTLYAASAAVGAVGVAVIAGHTALETAAVGGLFGTRRRRVLVAVVYVQVAYLVGAVAGTAGAVTVPDPVHDASVGLLAGVLLLVGATTLRTASAVPSTDGIPE